MSVRKPGKKADLTTARDCVESAINSPTRDKRKERLRFCLETWGHDEIDKLVSEWEQADNPSIAERGRELRGILEEIRHT